MKHLSFLLPFLTALIFSADAIHAQAVSSAAFGSTVAVWSGHTTVRERIDAGVNERIELWNRTWIVSPSGQTYANTNNWGFNAPDGYSPTTITFNEVGRWSYWASDGGSIDSYVYGDTASDWYIWPHNAPNGVGYGGWGRRLTSYIDVGASNNSPTISWTTTPGTVVSGQSYTITAHGHDPDGNLAQVNVWKNGVGFAFAGGGDGTDGNSGNTTADTGPATITFTANAVDSDGATSATISQTVTISAANTAPTVAWNVSPGTVASEQAYTVSAHGHDADGNLAQVNVWKNGVAFAFVGGGNGTDNDSGNTTSDSGPVSVTFTANAVDSLGVASGTISQTVIVSAPNRAPTAAITGSTALQVNEVGTWNFSAADQDGNLSAWRFYASTNPGAAWSAASGGAAGPGSYSVSFPAPGAYTWMVDAQDAAGATGSASLNVTVSALPAVTASISASPSNSTAPGSSTISWTSANATSVSVSGSGINNSAASGSQTVTGLTAGTYNYTITAQGPSGPTTQTATVTVSAPANNAPTVAWNTTPGTVANGQSYTVSAHGHDADGNMVQVNVWKSGVGFAFASGGDGTDGDSGNSTSDSGPATITFTANAVDSAGAASATISQTVTVAAPASVTASITATPTSATAPGTTMVAWSSTNATAVLVSGSGLNSSATSGSQAISGLSAGSYTYTITAQGSGGPSTQSVTVTVSPPANNSPTIAWNTTPGTVASGQSYTISAHGHDADGNLVQVNVWKNGVGFAFAGGGDGTDGDSGNPTSDAGPATITFTANAVDSAGAASATISQTVTVAAPASVTASITATPTSATAPGTTTITWSSNNATAVSVSGSGLNSSATNGSQTISGLAAGSYTYTITAQGSGGPVTQAATFTVTSAVSVSASINTNPTTTTAPGTATITWASANATSASVSGNGLNNTAVNGSQTVSGLAAGTYNYTITAQGPNGPATQTATLTVTPLANSAPTIAWTTTPGTVANGQSYTVSAHGHDADGNLVQVNVWKSGSGFAFAGGGNGTDSDSGNPTSDAGPASITFTANAVDSTGATSATISQTVTIAAPAAVTASITATPTSTAAPGTTTIAWTSANATSVSVSGNGVSSTATSGSQSVSGLAAGTYNYTITAQGPNGPAAQTATITVTSAPTVAGSINASPTTGTEPASTTISWSTSNATSVAVTGPGISSAAASGGQNIIGLTAGTYTYTLTAQGNGGPITRTATVTVSTGANVSGSISVSPATMAWGGTATLTWTTANATSVKVSGYGITGSPYQNSPSLTVSVGGLSPGETTWTLIADGPGGPITRTATINVTTSDGLYSSITASPTVIYSNQTATLNWTTTGAGFRWVHGYQPGLNGVNVYPADVSGSTTVSSLPPGDYRFTIEYGPGSSTTRMSFADLAVLGVSRTVTASVLPAGTGSATGAGTYAEGSSATLTAMPDATHVFTGWSGDLSGTANPLTFTVGAQNYNVVANFVLRLFAVTASVSPAGAGSVTGAGNYTLGATATLSATPDATHVFTGWSGDISGSANPVSFAVNNATNVTANFVASSFTLTTAASSGGSVTPGGTYPAGTTVTLSATPDATHRFTDWTGDASGSASPIAVTLDRGKFVQANFTARTAQTIAFDPPGDHGLASPPFALTASATSGLPVSFSLLSGPAILTGNSVQVTGAGPVTLQANQPGDAFFLPAVPVNQTFNVIAAATLKYRGQSRTLLRDETTREAPPFVLEKP